jgi:hypothetical protein
VPETARKHLQSLKELREQLESTKAQTDALIQQVEADLQRELPDTVRSLCADDRPRRRR